MANVQRGAWLHDGAEGAKRIFQELLELSRGHPVALDRETVFRVALVDNVVRRICEHQIRSVAGHQPSTSARFVASPTRSL